MLDAGKYNKKIDILQITEAEDSGGFVQRTTAIVLSCWASVKTTKGFTLITSHTDFEKAYTNFTIRRPHIEITRDMQIRYRDKLYTIEYLNNIDEADLEIEMQCKEVTK